MANRVAVFRREHFNAAHRLYNSQWSDDQNNEIFGKCSLPHYHGHNYEMEIKVVGVPDENTGFVMDMKKLSEEVLALGTAKDIKAYIEKTFNK